MANLGQEHYEKDLLLTFNVPWLNIQRGLYYYLLS